MDTTYIISDDELGQMLEVAARYRESNGGHLDDLAIQAVAEATGVPHDYVRLALKVRFDREKRSFLARVRAQILTLTPDARLYFTSGVLAIAAAILNCSDWLVARFTRVFRENSSYGIFAMIAIIAVCLAAYNSAKARDPKGAFVSAALFGTLFYFGLSVFSLIFGIRMQAMPTMLVPIGLGAGMIGLGLHIALHRYRSVLGMKDPGEERQLLLKQLVDLQHKLREGEQTVTFVSIDVVGSTQMKVDADPLAIEFTFTEYHRFVESIVEKHNGRIHSTAGDGITCAFREAPSAWTASKHILGGLFELNAFRNKIGTPLELRIGLHTGEVVAPTAGDIRSVNFAHVIDIAAHMQKYAPVGGIMVSDETAKFLPGGATAIGTDRTVVSGISATIHVPKQLSLPPLSPSAANVRP